MPARPRSRNRPLLAVLLALAAGAAAAPAARAWDARGHRVVAAIAWEEMSPAARGESVDLLLAAPADSGLPALMPAGGSEAERRRRLFLESGTWPDVVRDDDHPARQEKYHRSNWHYINLFWEEGPDGAPRERTDLRPHPTNAAERFDALIETLADRGADPGKRGIALAWIVHLAGDLHQPLHTSARVTATEPEGDRGGNLVLLDRQGDRQRNLHAYWDEILAETPECRCWLARWRCTDDRLARRLAAEHPSAAAPEPSRPESMSWVREGLVLAQTVAYRSDFRRGAAPPPAYRDAAVEASEEAIARSGRRLAAVLEGALGAP